MALLPGQVKYPHIFQPGRIGKIETKNRIKFAATETNWNHRDGTVSDKEVAWMEEVAKGGPGVVTSQGAYTDPRGEGKGYVGMMAIYDDRFIPGLKRIADVIHKHGAVACLQLMHCGRVGGIELDYTVGPSEVPQRLPRFRPPRAMTKEQIEEEIENHAQGARRALEAGFDMIEISGIVGYLISNFLSSYTNKRTDEYGGPLENRCRFMVEIIKAVRRVVGPDVPVGIRLCADELLDDRGGNTPEESLETIKMAEAAGVDYISPTAGWQESAYSVITRDIPQGHWLYLGERVKKSVKIPVVMAYRLFNPAIPEQAIADGIIDFWEMCRPMIADPHKPLKILEGREEDVIPCMACNLCLARLFRDQPVTCMVNPRAGHYEEEEWQIRPARDKKRVIVIGGGPAGLQAAAVAAERGHDVTLYEKKDRFGGQLAIAAKGPYGDHEFNDLINYLVTRCKKAGVKLVLNKEVTPKDFEDPLKNPNAIILATGAEVARPDIPGIDRPNVVSAHDVVDGKVQVGDKVCIIGGTGVGIATALYTLVTMADLPMTAEEDTIRSAVGKLIQEGKQVSIVEQGRKLGRDVNPSYIWRYVKKLKEAKASIFTSSKVKEIRDEGVVILDPEGKEVTIPADTVILGGPLQSRKELAEPLEFACDELHIIGDAATPRRAHNAIMDGYRVGLRV